MKVAFDFDTTLMYPTDDPIGRPSNFVKKLISHVKNGDEVYIITSRNYSDQSMTQIREFLNSVKVMIPPSRIYHTNTQDKGDFIYSHPTLDIDLLYDDDTEELKNAAKYGIKGILAFDDDAQKAHDDHYGMEENKKTFRSFFQCAELTESEKLQQAVMKDPKFQSWFKGSKAIDKNGNPMVMFHGTQSDEHFTVFSIDGVPFVEDDDAEEETIRDPGSGADPNAFMGAHFAQEPEVASKFAMADVDWLKNRSAGRSGSGRVYPVFLNIKNPAVFNKEQDLNDFIYSQDSGSDYVEYAMEDLIHGENYDEDETDDKYAELLDDYSNSESKRLEVNMYAMALANNMEGEENHAVHYARELGYEAREALIRAGHDGVKYKNDVEGGISWIAFHPNQIKSALSSAFTSDDDIMKEDIVPRKPHGRTTKRKIIKNKGTNTAYEIIQYMFKTKSGNNVKVHFKPQYENSYDVVFYVNDTLDDESSTKVGTERDKEVLNGVLYTVKRKADELGAKELTFEAWVGKGDIVNKKDMNLEKPRNELKAAIEEIGKSLQSYVPKPVPHSKVRIAVAQKYGKELVQLYDIDKGQLMTLLADLDRFSDTKDKRIISVINDIMSFIHNDSMGSRMIYSTKIDPDGKLKIAMQNYKDALMSHEAGGVDIKRNRRASIYERLMKRYFADEWDIKNERNYFTLTRK